MMIEEEHVDGICREVEEGSEGKISDFEIFKLKLIEGLKVVLANDHKLLQEWSLTVRQPRRAPFTPCLYFSRRQANGRT